MKLLTIIIIIVALAIAPISRSHAQEHEAAVLLLNLEKLNQLREILQKMYDGYRTLQQGYGKVKDIASGNFKLHELFLDGLYLVSPEVRKYYKIANIIETQVSIVKSYRSAFRIFQNSGVYNPQQIEYLATVYSRLFNDSLRSLDELLLVITSRQLRMSDAERITAIDRIDTDMQQKWTFLRTFNNQQKLLTIAKLKDKSELKTLRGLHGITP
ncbi:TerB family tellurite resistance protein [Chitinophaga sp. NPDC101104]|uniref:TerB family tellurite resistance protein n=1 Tax=Chitinophaga sp. NPDC101104 TaxID=3390561 RepID=UPI003D002FB0